MSRLFLAFLSLLPLVSAFAQAEAPPEPTNTVAVVLFLVLFVGSCVGFIGYTVWSHRKEKQRDPE